MREWHPYARWFALFLVLLATIIAVGGLILLNDIRTFQKTFETQEKMFLLDVDGSIQAGFVLSDIKEGSAELISASDVKIASSLYREKQYSLLRGNNSLLFAMQDSVFTVNELNLNETTLSKTTILNVISSATPLQLFASVSDTQVETLKNSFSDEELRVYLFSRLILEEINKRGINFIVEEAQKGNILIEPQDSFMMRTLQILPLNIMKPLTPEQDIPDIKVK